MLSEHIVFVIERITDILKIEEEKEVEHMEKESKGILKLLSKRRKQKLRDGIRELKNELSHVVGKVRSIEEGCDEQLHGYDQFYIELSAIAVSSDYLLNDFIINDVTDNIYDVVQSILNWGTRNDIVSNINVLVSKIRNLQNLLLPSISNYYISIVGNTNLSGQQSIGPINISVHDSESSQMKGVSRPKSYGHVPNSDLVGFKNEIQTLLNFLIDPHVMNRVVGVVGPGGSGKTTLAKHIYHHPQIKIHFTRKIWVCVSRSWDKAGILNAIIRQVNGNPKAPEMGYDQVVDCLSKIVCSESYLVILDDIWCIDAWYDISPALVPCSGCKVVITTRNKFLPLRIDPSVLIVEPKQLNDEQSYELFKRRAFFIDEHTPHELQSLGAEMVKKCKGLPLAIIALAGVLLMDKSRSSWERLMHKMLNIANESTQGIVKEVLALSYYELPRHLKSCVLYLRVFPDGYEIEAQKLIHMWIAERFLDEISKAKEYLEEMAQRCIIEVVKTNYKGEVRRFQIHDLIRQMFVDMNQERGYLKDSLRLAPSKTRFLGPETNSHVRCLILLNYLDFPVYILNRLFVKFKLLRVLILHNIYEKKMPEEIGNLIHLRYLELMGDIKLPRSISNLENLWTLDIRYIFQSDWNGTAVNTLHKLKELRHLYLPKKASGWGKIAVEKTKLKTLWNAKGGRWMLSGMSELSALLQELCIRDIESKKQLKEVFRTPSIMSNNLKTLELRYNTSPIEYRDMISLRKCNSLNKLKLKGLVRVSTLKAFPPKLIKLELKHTFLEEKEVMNIISKSCPCLKILIFGTWAYDGSELVNESNSFPLLEKLTLRDLTNLKTWIIEESAMPRLHHLTIKECGLLELNHEGWERILKIPQLECEGLNPKIE